MKDQNKSKQELLDEISNLRELVSDLQDKKLTNLHGVFNNEETKENLNILALIAEQVSDSILTTDLNFKINWANKANNKLFGYSCEELLGRTPNFLNAEPLAEQIQNEIYETVSNGKIWKGEVLNKRKDGSTFPCELLIFPLYDEEGKIFAYAGHQRDITDRKKTDELLKETIEFSENVIETANAIVLVLKGNGTIVTFNEFAEKLTGYKKDEVLGKNWFEIFIPDEEKEKLKSVHNKVQRQESKGKTFENSILTKSDEEKLISWSNSSLQNESGEIIGSISIGIDITERKMAEEEIRKLSRLQDNMLDNAPIWISTLDNNGKVQLWNRAAERISGYSKKEVLGDSKIWEWLYPDVEYRNKLFVSAKNLMEKELPFENYETCIKVKNGEERTVKWLSKFIKDENGKVVESIALGLDITESKMAEEALKESKENLSLIYDTVSDVLFQISVEPGDVFRFKSINNAFLILTGLTTKDIIGKKVDEVISEPAVNLVLEKYKEAIHEKKTISWEETSVYPTGELTGVVTVTPAFNAKDICTHIIGAVHDITDRKQAEEKMKKQMGKLEKLNELMVGREKKMIELKNEINNLLEKLGKPQKYHTPDLRK